MSENLLPREAYDGKMHTRTWLFAAVAGVLFGGAMCVVFAALGAGLFALVGDYHQIRPFLRFNLVIWSIGGLAFGVLYLIGMRRFVPRLTSGLVDQIYDRDPSIAPPPVNDAEFRYRLPAGFLRSAYSSTGGILYLGAAGIMFSPHNKNRTADCTSVNLGPLEALQLSVVQPKVSFFARLAATKVHPALRISAGAHSADFSVPDPNANLAVIQKALDELRSSG